MSGSRRGGIAFAAGAALALGAWGSGAFGQCAGIVSDKILAPDGSAYDAFGGAVDVDGDVLVIGAPGDSDDGLDSGSAYVFAQASAISFDEHTIETGAAYAIGVRVADIDSDGDADIVTAWRNADTIAWHENLGAGAFVTHVIVASPDTFADGASAVDAADIDGDGDVDIVATSLENNRVAWYENLGGSPPTFAPHALSSSEDTAFAVRAGDLDADGDVDIVVADYGSSQVVWFDNDAMNPPTFTRRVVSSNVPSATSVDLADVNDDGALDVVWTAYADDAVGWLESDGAGGGTPPTFTRHAIATDAAGAWAVRAGDLDHDGDVDVVCASINDDEVAWFESDGASPPSFTRRSVTSALSDPRSVDLADVDGDGDVDVVTGSSTDHTFAWHENDGASPPSFTQHTLSSSATGAWGVDAADVDGDGFVDVATVTTFGAVAWYENDGLAWREQAKLTAPDAAPGDSFGWSVAISGDTIMVGAYADADAGENSGSVYVYQRSGSAWNLATKLTGTGPDDLFGWSIGLDADTALIGAQGDDENGLRAGAAHVYTRSAGVWSHAAKLLPSDPASEDVFGWSVALSGGTALIGAKDDDDDALSAGAAYVFVGSGDSWSEQAKLTAGTGVGMMNDNFGYAVSLDGDDAAIAAPFTDDLGAFSGAVYLFRRSGAVWAMTDRLTDPAGSAGDEFGLCLKLAGDRLLVGSYRNDAAGTNAGSATMFERLGALWSPDSQMTAFDAAPGDLFGVCVTLAGDSMFVGATRTDDRGTNSGAVYAMTPPPVPACPGDVDGDDDTDVFDFGALAMHFGTPSGATRSDGDLDCDGDVDVFDFAIFAVDFGCAP